MARESSLLPTTARSTPRDSCRCPWATCGTRRSRTSTGMTRCYARSGLPSSPVGAVSASMPTCAGARGLVRTPPAETRWARTRRAPTSPLAFQSPKWMARSRAPPSAQDIDELLQRGRSGSSAVLGPIEATGESDRAAQLCERVHVIHEHRWGATELQPLGLLMGGHQDVRDRGVHVPGGVERLAQQIIRFVPARAAFEVQQRDVHGLRTGWPTARR